MVDKQLSIVIPVYNGANYIDRALQSTGFINHNEIEVIVVDDKSTDETLYNCKKYLVYDNFVLIKQEKRMGVSAARNRGLKFSTAPYIAFLDCDDQLLYESITNWLEVIKNGSKCDLHIWGCKELKGEKTKSYCLPKDQVMTKESYINGMFWNDFTRTLRYGVLWGKIYKKSIIINNGLLFDESTHLGEDTWFNIDFYGYMNNVCIHSEISYLHICHTDSLSNQACSNYSEILNITEKKYEQLFRSVGKTRYSPFLIKKHIEAISRKHQRGVLLGKSCGT